MHPATRQAIQVMLNGINQQVAGIQALLGSVAADSSAVIAAPRKPEPAAAKTFLSEAEEDQLEADLGMDQGDMDLPPFIPPQQEAVQALMETALGDMDQYTDEQRNAAFLRGHLRDD